MEFKIVDDRGYELVFHTREISKRNWIEFYSVTLAGPQMKGTIKVDNVPYGESPVHLLQSIEREWKGWSGEKGWGSLEGEFNLSATSDRTGHIFLNARIQSGFAPPSSCLELELIVESGQMANLVKEAQVFFDASRF